VGDTLNVAPALNVWTALNILAPVTVCVPASITAPAATSASVAGLVLDGEAGHADTPGTTGAELNVLTPATVWATLSTTTAVWFASAPASSPGPGTPFI
jgi:hypothetical protein